MKPAIPLSRQMLLLIGAVLFAIAGRVYLSNGGAEAMVFTAPQLRSADEVRTLIGFAALAVAVSAAVAAAGKRWVGRLASIGLGGIAGLLAISQFNAILGAAIGLAVGLLISCGIFIAVLAAVAPRTLAVAGGVVCGAAALATQRDLRGGPDAITLLLIGATALAAAFVIFGRSRKTALAEWKRRWLGRLGRTSLFMLMIFGLWVSLSVDTVRRVNRVGYQGNLSPLTPELSWLWRGCVKVTFLFGKPDLGDGELVGLRNFTNLEYLNLSKTAISDAGLDQLRGLPRLRYLILDGTKITGTGFGNLASLPALAELNLDGTKVNDQNLKSLAGLTVIRTLSLKNTAITDAALASIGKLVTLRGIGLSGTRITDSGLTELQGLTALNTLDLSETQITGDGLQCLAPMTWLQHLDLSNTQITDAGLEKLPALPMLTQLRLDGTAITDAGLAPLKNQPLLYYVEIRQTAITDEGAEELYKAMRRRSAMPRCEVIR